jgi:X breakpoint 2-interacting protein
MDPNVTSTPLSLPPQYLHHYMEDSVGFESPPRLDLESSIGAVHLTHEHTFCNNSNITSCLVYLNQELTTLGFSSILHKESQEMDRVQIVNCVYDLLQQHHHHIKCREDLETSLHRAHSDVSLLKDTKARLKATIEELEKEVASVSEKERQALKKLKSVSSKLRAEQDEMRRLKLSMQHKETQFSHDVRKKEREYSRLRERLGQLVSDKSQERRLGMEILNALQRGDGKRARWRYQSSSVKHDEELYRVVIANYEEKQKEMIAENSSLRESLVMIQKELVSVLNEKSLSQSLDKSVSGDIEGDSSEGVNQEELMSSGHFQMPYELVRDGIERSVHSKWQKVKEQFSLLRTRVTSEDDYKSEIEKLEKRIADYESLMEKNTASGEGEGYSKRLNESWLAQQNDHLVLRKEYISEREKHLEERERAFMEATACLDREREDFEQRKTNFFKEQFLNGSLFSTSFLNSSSSQDRSNSPLVKHAPRSSSVQNVCASPDLRHKDSTGSPVKLYKNSPLHTKHQLPGSQSTPLVKRRQPIEIQAVSAPPRRARDRTPVDYLDLEYSLVLSPEKQQARVLNECESPSLEGEKHKAIMQHSTEVRRALEKRKGDAP